MRSITGFFRRRKDARSSARGPAGARDLLAEELDRRRRPAGADDAEVGDALVPREPHSLDAADRTLRSLVAVSAGQDVPPELVRGIDPKVLKLLTPQLAHEFGALPLRIDGDRVVLCVGDTPSHKLEHELRWLISIGSERPRKCFFQVVPRPLLLQCLDIYYPWSANSALIPSSHDLLRLFAQSGGASGPEVLRPHTLGPASVRSLVNGILMKAVYRGANDVLFEPFETEFRVRFKVEGECEYAMTPLPPNAGPQVLSVIKQHAKLDIAETEKTQDGRFSFKVDLKGEVKDIQFRIAITPTINGEECVIRLHDNSERKFRLDSVGADPRTLDALYRARDHRRGLILFSGPTGSGKTTTLAAILSECDSVREKIVTIEDPVEIRLPGITQTAVNEIKGETFARLLRNALRRTPDRILVGEIRDSETAHLAVKGALTGHQVLSTVHSEDAPRVVTRMLEEGVSAFNLSSVLFLVIAQRLLNRLCEHCARPVVYDAEVLAREQFSPAEYGDIGAREAPGCAMCHHKGTYGRIAIYETMVVTDEMKKIIARRAPTMESDLRREAVRTGMRPLRRCGLDLVKKGTVALAQVVEMTSQIPDDVLPEVWASVSPLNAIEDYFDPNATGEWMFARSGERAPSVAGARNGSLEPMPNRPVLPESPGGRPSESWLPPEERTPIVLQSSSLETASQPALSEGGARAPLDFDALRAALERASMAAAGVDSSGTSAGAGAASEVLGPDLPCDPAGGGKSR